MRRSLPMALVLVLLAAVGCGDTGESGDGETTVPQRRGKADSTEAALTIVAGGDVMMGTDFPSGYLPANDGAASFASVGDTMARGDITFVNLEGPLCDSGTTSKCSEGSNCYAFRTPTRYVENLLTAGIDVVSLANNHALDFGEGCRAETMATLDEVGIAYSGRPGSVATLGREGVTVALVAFHTAPHSNWLLDTENAVAMVTEASSSHDIVVVSFHGGAEGEAALHVPDGPETFYGEDRGDLRRFARAVIDAGADLVLGHGPHVPRAMEVYRGRLVAYSLGNFNTYGRFSLRGNKGVSFILDAELSADGRLLRGAIHPVVLVDGGVPVPDEEARATSLLRDLTDEDFPETGVVIADDGTFLPPESPDE